MQLDTQLIPDWPKLAWVAVFADGDDTITVYHGPMVETTPDWCVEAVWAGDFAQGDFDRTDLVFGSGVRCRDSQVVFVSAGSTLDRLCYCQGKDAWHVSNSLPALLAAARLSLRSDYPDYPDRIQTICEGLGSYRREIPVESGNVKLLYFSNLTYDGRTLTETDKPDSVPTLTSFTEYGDFLADTARDLGENGRSPERKHPAEPMSTISSGYDSTAVALIAKHAGCRQAVTIAQSTSLWRGSDSGAHIAETLGIGCTTYPRTASYYPLEEPVWAVTGRAGILNWTLFDYPSPLCLLFSGCHADKLWERRRKDLPDPFAIPSMADLGMGEFRLLRGVVHCPLPFCGMRHWREIEAISFSEEMAAWTLNTDYDRPIPRRLLEEAGVPRRAFGIRKKNTSTETTFLWPYSEEAQLSFGEYLREQGVHCPSRGIVRLMRRLSRASNLIYQNTFMHLNWSWWPRPWRWFRSQRMLFQWANTRLSETYAEGLRRATET